MMQMPSGYGRITLHGRRRYLLPSAAYRLILLSCYWWELYLVILLKYCISLKEHTTKSAYYYRWMNITIRTTVLPVWIGVRSIAVAADWSVAEEIHLIIPLPWCALEHDHQVVDGEDQYLVKYKDLPYTDATWEHAEDLEHDQAEFHCCAKPCLQSLAAVMRLVKVCLHAWKYQGNKRECRQRSLHTPKFTGSYLGTYILDMRGRFNNSFTPEPGTIYLSTF